MANSSNRPARPVRDEGIAPLPREAPYYRGQADQGDLSTRKADLLHTGTIGHVPGRADSPNLQAMHVEDRVPYKRPGYKSSGPQAGPRPLPREVSVYSIPAPGGTGRFTRYADGHTEHHRERPEMVEYMNSLHPVDDADERESVASDIQAADDTWGHKFW